MKNHLLYTLLWLLPKNFLTSIVGYLVSLNHPAFIMKTATRGFARLFKLNMQEAEKPLEQYNNIQELFTRRLKKNARTICQEPSSIVSPSDGTISQSGTIHESTLIQAKGKSFTLDALLKNPSLEKLFKDGSYCTIYLSPKDYHRFHMPIDGTIISTYYLPGSLWPVNNFSVQNVDSLFCQNERFVSVGTNGQMHFALIYVAATMVGNIHLNYLKAYPPKTIDPKYNLMTKSTFLNKGDELGTFRFGSTIILLMEYGFLQKFYKTASDCVKMGESLGLISRQEKEH